jgi:hypothetical protein
MASNSHSPYDPNHVFPVKDLENDRVKLTFFIVSPPEFELKYVRAYSMLVFAHYSHLYIQKNSTTG